MGKIVTPTYRVEYRDNTRPSFLAQMAWHGKQDGRANAANLENWRKEYNSSFQPGGSNGHISKTGGGVPHICYARIMRQRDNKVMAEVRAPAFEVA